jgi:hypothetical protein
MRVSRAQPDDIRGPRTRSIGLSGLLDERMAEVDVERDATER